MMDSPSLFFLRTCRLQVTFGLAHSSKVCTFPHLRQIPTAFAQGIRPARFRGSVARASVVSSQFVFFSEDADQIMAAVTISLVVPGGNFLCDCDRAAPPVAVIEQFATI